MENKSDVLTIVQQVSKTQTNKVRMQTVQKYGRDRIKRTWNFLLGSRETLTLHLHPRCNQSSGHLVLLQLFISHFNLQFFQTTIFISSSFLNLTPDLITYSQLVSYSKRKLEDKSYQIAFNQLTCDGKALSISLPCYNMISPLFCPTPRPLSYISSCLSS